MTARMMKSPRPKEPRCSSTTRPMCRPLRMRSRSSSSAPAIIASRRVRAGRPPNSLIRLPVAAVTVNGSPTGRQPWETRGRTPRPAGRAATTAPSVKTSSSSRRRFPPGREPADANPPTRVVPPGTDARRASASNEKGSPIARRDTPSPRSGGSGVPGSGRNRSTGPVWPAQRTMADVSSTSWRCARTETAVAPRRWRAPSVSLTTRPSRPAPATWGAVRNRTAMSGPGPMRSSTWPTTSPMATPASGCSERATAKRTRSTNRGIRCQPVGWVGARRV